MGGLTFAEGAPASAEERWGIFLNAYLHSECTLGRPAGAINCNYYITNLDGLQPGVMGVAGPCVPGPGNPSCTQRYSSFTCSVLDKLDDEDEYIQPLPKHLKKAPLRLPSPRQHGRLLRRPHDVQREVCLPRPKEKKPSYQARSRQIHKWNYKCEPCIQFNSSNSK